MFLLSTDIRKDGVLIPGVTCTPLPDCPTSYESGPLSLDIRQNEDLIPGVTCNAISLESLPDCPITVESAPLKLDLRQNEDSVPGRDSKYNEIWGLGKRFCMHPPKIPLY